MVLVSDEPISIVPENIKEITITAIVKDINKSNIIGATPFFISIQSRKLYVHNTHLI